MKPKTLISNMLLKWYFYFLFVVIFTNQAYCQITQPTTELEYNYVTNGYKKDFANGQDIKKGYLLKDIQQDNVEGRRVQLKGLYRVGENTPCAIMVIYSKEGQETQYFCVPSYKSSFLLWSKFYESLDDKYGSQEKKYSAILFTLAKAQMKSFEIMK